MSDRTRRFVCRVTFVLFCLLPTLIVANWALFPRTPREWQLALQPNFGLLLLFDDVATRTPFKTEFTQVQVADTQRRLLTVIPRVIWSHEPAAHEIELAPFEISRDAWTRGCRHLLDASQGATAPMQFFASSLTIKDDATDAAITLRDCRIQVQPQATGTAVVAEFKLDPAGQPLRWEFQWPSESTGDSCNWALDTETNAMPAWLLSGDLPALAKLGSTATLRGHIVSYLDAGRRVHDVRELVVDNIDLQAAFTPSFEFDVTGRARIAVRSAQLVDGRVHFIDASFECPQGTMDRRLIESACKWLRLQCAVFSSDVVEFERCAFDLEIRDRQLFIRNTADTGALMFSSASRTPIVSATEESLGLTPHVLANCLAPADAYAVPADQRALQILQFLPLFD